MLFSGLSTLLFLLGVTSVYYYSYNEREDTFRTRLRNRALSSAKIFSSLSDSTLQFMQRMDASVISSLQQISITIVGQHPEKTYRYADMPGDTLFLPRDVIETAKHQKIYYFKDGNRTALALHYTAHEHDFVVGVAAVDTDGRLYLQQLKSILLVVLGAAVVLSFITGLLFARQLLRPVQRMMEQVAQISSGNLSQRIEVGKGKDELIQLAQTFNQLLERLEESFILQRRFISNASHELSTPLTAISSQLEVALQKPRSAEEYRMVMQSIEEDIIELQQLTRSLLDIAKTGSGGSIDLETLRLDELLLKVAAQVQRMRQGARVNIHFDEFPENEQRLMLPGNAQLLQMALRNVIENAVKYSNNKTAEITANFGLHDIVIRICNRGNPIPEADLPFIFQPFFRSANAGSTPGSGLGLTLSKRIIGLHKGNIEVHSSEKDGTCFTVTLPNLVGYH